MVKGEMYTIKLTSGLIPFRSTVIKLYLQPELTKEPTLYDAVEYIKPAQTNKPVLLLQEAAPQLVLKRGQGYPRKYPLLIAIADITIYLQDNAI